jgi:itaconate CoA-transferase
MSLAGVLTGVRVVSFEQAVAAPFATRQLADLGAEVIKVERPDGGDVARNYDRAVHGEASYFVWLNRGKKSVVLDLKAERDLTIARMLVEQADVVVQNLLPGAMARLGLDFEVLTAQRPELIAVSISGYGESGPSGDRKAYDLILQAETGMLEVTGDEEHRAKVGISVVDIATGMYGFSAVLAALVKRRDTGRGGHISLSMLDAVGEWMAQPFYYETYGDQPLRRSGASHATISPYGPYRVADGEVFLAVTNDREWASLCRNVLNAPEFTLDPRFVHNTERVANRREVTAIIEYALNRVTVEQVRAKFDAAGIANTKVGHPADLGDHPQLKARERWTDVRTPGGTVVGLRPPLLPDGGPAELGSVPRLGEHTDEIVAQLNTTHSNPE